MVAPTSPSPLKKKNKKKDNPPPTSNIHSGINVASSLIFSLILSLRRLSTALWLSSFVVSHLPVGLVCRLLSLAVLVVVVLVDHHPLVLQRKEEKHGKAGGAGLAELVDFEGVEDRREALGGRAIKLTACVSNPFGSECECAWWE